MGVGIFFVGKGGRVAFEARGTYLICCWEHIRWAGLFPGKLMFQVPCIVKFEVLRVGKKLDELF